MSITVGKELSWVHGEQHRIATVLVVEANRVKLSGLTTDYWVNKKTLIKKLTKPYPIGCASF